MPPTARDFTETPALVGVVGRSGSGKTTLLERLIPALASRGLAVGAIKHTSHGFLADRPGKDSYRLYESGADAVALVSSEQLATFARTRPRPDREPSLGDALASLPRGLDLVLVEGFSWEPIPRLVLAPGSEDPLPKHLTHGDVLRIVRVPEPLADEKPALSRRLIDSLAQELAGIARQRRRTLACTPAISPAPDSKRSSIPTQLFGGPPGSSG